MLQREYIHAPWVGDVFCTRAAYSQAHTHKGIISHTSIATYTRDCLKVCSYAYTETRRASRHHSRNYKHNRQEVRACKVGQRRLASGLVLRLCRANARSANDTELA